MPVCAAPVQSGSCKGGWVSFHMPHFALRLEKVQAPSVQSGCRVYVRRSVCFQAPASVGQRGPALCEEPCWLSSCSLLSVHENLCTTCRRQAMEPVHVSDFQPTVPFLSPSPNLGGFPQTDLSVSHPVKMIPLVLSYLQSLGTAACRSRPSVVWPGGPCTMWAFLD